MSNKIDGYGIQQPALPVSGRAPAAGNSKGSESGGPVRAVPVVDSVALTEDAHSLQRLEKAVAAAPVADSERVDKIRAQLRDGSYQINPRAIADSLARMEWELGTP